MIHVGDCLEVMRKLEANSFDSVVTDPPYHLTAGKKGGSGPASVNLESPYGRARIGTGFMGKAWDGGDVAHRPETWAEVLRVAKPGAYLAAFSGTRTFHRMVCAIEDAGWEIRDTAMWVYGSGFPKSHNGDWGGTALKPAWEPITLARKPLEGTVEANWRKWGTGALNIDKCRVGDTVETWPGSRRNGAGDGRTCARGSGEAQTVSAGPSPAGRWPANVIHDGSEEVVALFPREAGAAAPVHRRNGDKFRNTFGEFSGQDVDEGGNGYQGDTGSAARFFYCAKASRADRNDGCDGMEERPLLWSSGTKRAAAKHRIEKVGAGAAASSNCSLKPLWRHVAPPTTSKSNGVTSASG